MAKKGVKLGATYIIALIATFLLFGFIGVVYVNMLMDDTGSNDELPVADVSDKYSPSVADDRTILAIVDLGEGQSDVSFMLMRFLPRNTETVFLPLPANMFFTAVDGSETNLNRLYRDNSAAAVKAAVKETFDVTVDKYVIFDREDFGIFCDIFGNTNYNIPFNIDNPDGTVILAGDNYLDRNAMRSLLTYSGYKGGEEERARRFCEIMTSMLNKDLTSSFTPLLDAAFSDIINSGVETDISRLDYDESRAAIVHTLETTDKFCRQILSSGSLTENGNYIVDPSFITAVQTWFDIQPE
jgi:anionic cell wall polymer biosynthesis LytR-Cps2A-Psr (LCP) family protein